MSLKTSNSTGSLYAKGCMEVINWFLSSKWNQLLFFMIADAVPASAVQYRIWYHYHSFYRRHIDSDSIAFRQLSIPYSLLKVMVKGSYKELGDSAINVSAITFKLFVVLEVVYVGLIMFGI